MRFRQYITEEYCSSLGKDLPIYVNPSSVEIGKLGRHAIRFIADQRTNKLYIWNGDEAIHVDIFDHLIKKNEMEPVEAKYIWKSSELLTGVANNSSGKLNFSTSDQIFGDIERMKRGYEEDYLYDMMKYNWNWLKPYFTDLKFIDMIRKRVKES